MWVRAIRGGRVPSLAGAVALAMASVACAPRTLRHDFDPRRARDYGIQDQMKPTDLIERGSLAVLLVPENTTLERVTTPRLGSPLGVPDNLYDESYFGPARVFLVPGERHYTVSVNTLDGVVKLELEAMFEPHKTYELVIVENSDQVAFELFELHESSYAALYPDG